MSGSPAPRIAVIDYGIGNLRSAEKALIRCGADANLTSEPADLADADGVVLPGVGNFGACVRALSASGMRDATLAAAGSGRPFLGICVGMQMLYEGSDEAPDAAGLGVIPGRLELLPDDVKRPQMQWNRLDTVRASAMFADIGEAWMYFVHSYAVFEDPGAVATCEYGRTVVAATEHGSVWATQFHPEKSSSAGMALLSNFVDACAAREKLR